MKTSQNLVLGPYLVPRFLLEYTSFHMEFWNEVSTLELWNEVAALEQGFSSGTRFQLWSSGTRFQLWNKVIVKNVVLFIDRTWNGQERCFIYRQNVVWLGTWFLT